MADSNQGEISKMLNRLVIFSRHEKALPEQDPETGKLRWKSPERGSADLTGGTDRQMFIECKACDESFAFSQWTEPQREWAFWARGNYGAEYWLAITFSSEFTPNHRINRATYLISYPAYMKLEEDIVVQFPKRKSIPYVTSKATRPKELHTLQMGMRETAERYALLWIPKVGWDVPVGHPFHTMYLLNRKAHHDG